MVSFSNIIIMKTLKGVIQFSTTEYGIYHENYTDNL